MMHFHISVELVNMSFNKNHILTETLYLLKGFTACMLSNEFPSKHFY